MEKMMKPKVPVSEMDQQKSYFKYYLTNSTPVAPEKLGKVFRGPMNPVNALPFAQRNRMFEPEFIQEEIGYCVMSDGTGYVSDMTFMPGVTAKMVDWWFAWRSLEPLRYVIGNPYSHIQAMTMQMEKMKDEDLSYQERYWDSTQTVVKVGEMGPTTEFMNFKCPSDVGFDMEQIRAEDGSSLICARCYSKGTPPFAQPDYFVTHHVHEVEGGVEVRSRYWLGWSVRYGRDYKELQDGLRMPPMLPMGCILQNMTEWAQLSIILPDLYSEEKDNFTNCNIS